jgi:hypothetical protein
MRAVALILSVGVLGCFPHNEKYRTYSKYAEGGLILAGIGAEVIASHHTGAMCDQAPGTIGYDASCHEQSSIYGGVGLAMIIAGLTGFVATVSTAEDDEKPAPPTIDIKAKEEKPAVKLPAGVTPPPPVAPPSGSADAPQKPAP